MTDAALNSSPPLSSRWQTGYLREGEPEPTPDQQLSADTEIVTATYFSTMRASLMRGRVFNERDTSSSPPVTVIDQLLADKIFPGEDPIGKRLRMDPDDAGENKMWEIVGVVGRMKARAFDDIDTLPVVYFPQRQVDRTNLTLLVRTEIPAGSLGTDHPRNHRLDRSRAAGLRSAQHVLARGGNLGAFPVHEFPFAHFRRTGAHACDGGLVWSAGFQRAATTCAKSGFASPRERRERTSARSF